MNIKFLNVVQHVCTLSLKGCKLVDVCKWNEWTKLQFVDQGEALDGGSLVEEEEEEEHKQATGFGRVLERLWHHLFEDDMALGSQDIT